MVGEILPESRILSQLDIIMILKLKMIQRDRAINSDENRKKHPN